jgi:hypothetical protein
MSESSVRATLGSKDMADALGISSKLLGRVRNLPDSPFKFGTHYRFQGVFTNAPIVWFPKETDEAFSTFRRFDPDSIETMDGGEADG